MKERLHYIDVCKGLLIIMVILHHLTNNARWTFGITCETFDVIDHCNELYLCFFMQAFFLMSGYCSNFSEPFPQFLKKNSKQLLLPAFCIAMLVRVIRFCIYQDISYIEQIFKPHFIAYAFGGYWFIYALFVCRILFWLINKYIHREYIIWLLVTIGLVLSIALEKPLRISNSVLALPNVFFWENTLANLPFLMIGYKLKKSLFGTKNLVLSSFAFIVMFGLLKIGGAEITIYTMSSNVTLFNVLEYVLLAYWGSLFIVSISKKIRYSSFLEKFGKQSLLVYCTHGLFLNVLLEYTNRYILSPKDIGSALLFYVFVATLTLLCCYFTIMAFETKYLSWILGKRKV